MNHERIAPTQEEAAKIEELLKAPYPVTLTSLARALHTSEFEAARRLPDEVASFVELPQEEMFDTIWEELASWEKVTLFIVHGGHVFEIAGKLSTGKRARGFYNILGSKATIGGHIRYEDIGAIAFTAFPFMGRESLSVAFFSTSGEVAFSVYAGRENHQIIPSVKDAFMKARSRFAS